MNRAQLEHIIRAAASIADDHELIVIGSQAILATFPEAPLALLASLDADLYPKNHPERADLIDGSIGELSPFHETFGYYAHGVAAETATLPSGWADRLVALRTPATGSATGWCLEVHDLCASKLAAGRPKDLDFVEIAVREGLVQPRVLAERLTGLPMTVDAVARLAARVERMGRKLPEAESA